MSDPVNYYVRCIQCKAKNRLPLSRLGQSPACGKCKQQLFADTSPLRREEIVLSCRECQAHNRIPTSRLGDQRRCGKCKSPLAVNFGEQDGALTLSDQNFTETVLLSPFAVLVNFHSPNCGPCKLLNPTVNKLAHDYQGRLRVGSLNVDVNQYIPSLYRVGGTPSLLLFRSGKEISRLEGYQPSGTITQWIQPHAW